VSRHSAWRRFSWRVPLAAVVFAVSARLHPTEIALPNPVNEQRRINLVAPSDRVTFVSAVNSREILHKNLLASPVFQSPRAHQLIVQEGFPSAARAYNDAIDRSENDLLILVHQDVILPGKWLADLGETLTHLSQSDPQWGVLGCYGETKSREDKGYVYSPDMGTIGKPLAVPELVQTLDEIVLILRKSSGLRFDETLPHFHF
jgi:hypothetical protein